MLKSRLVFQILEGLMMYLLELYQNNYSKDIVVFETLEEGKAFVAQIPGYTLENEDDFVQGNKVEITNV